MNNKILSFIFFFTIFKLSKKRSEKLNMSSVKSLLFLFLLLLLLLLLLSSYFFLFHFSSSRFKQQFLEISSKPIHPLAYSSSSSIASYSPSFDFKLFLILIFISFQKFSLHGLSSSSSSSSSFSSSTLSFPFSSSKMNSSDFPSEMAKLCQNSQV